MVPLSCEAATRTNCDSSSIQDREEKNIEEPSTQRLTGLKIERQCVAQDLTAVVSGQKRRI